MGISCCIFGAKGAKPDMPIARSDPVMRDKKKSLKYWRRHFFVALGWIFFCVSVAGCRTAKPTVSPADREMVLTNGTIITVDPLPNKQCICPDLGDIPFTGSLKI